MFTSSCSNCSVTDLVFIILGDFNTNSINSSVSLFCFSNNLKIKDLSKLCEPFFVSSETKLKKTEDDGFFVSFLNFCSFNKNVVEATSKLNFFYSRIFPSNKTIVSLTARYYVLSLKILLFRKVSPIPKKGGT